MAITQQAFDNLQFNLQQALDDIVRLKGRVTALEGGEALPPDQSFTVTPQPAETCTEYIEKHGPANFEKLMQQKSTEPAIETELDIARGMTTGGRRN